MPSMNPLSLLWFAFILLSLSYWKQRCFRWLTDTSGCDLLSFYYLCRTGNNFHRIRSVWRWLWFAFILLSLSYWKQRKGGIEVMDTVVICFHFTIFVVLETTRPPWPSPWGRLWFAFILLSLSYWKQLECGLPLMQISCDLLSFYYLCRTGNNRSTWPGKPIFVVICFHFTIFVVLETTIISADESSVMLWFAFILLSLSYWKQPSSFPRLSFDVVICFHFTIFVVLETTCLRLYRPDGRLWFAFILLSLSYWKQLES